MSCLSKGEGPNMQAQTREIPKGYSKGLGVLIGFVSTAELVARCLCVLASEKDLHVLVDKLQAVIWLQ